METPINPTLDYLGEEIQQLVAALTHAVAVEKIICFGSTTHRVVKKSCFEETGTANGLDKNSYSLLLIPSADNTLYGSFIQQRAEEAAQPIADVTAIVHSMEEVNNALKKGSGFFTAIYKKGTLFFDRNGLPFTTLGKGNPIASRISKREKFWDRRNALVNGFLQGAAFYRTVEQSPLAVYMLHQAVQHCYSGMLRVMTGYRTNCNGLNRLLRLIDATAPQPPIALPRETAEDVRLTKILLKGHSDARYEDSFEVSEVDVAQLLDRVSAIAEAADQCCRKRIQQLKAGEVAYIA